MEYKFFHLGNNIPTSKTKLYKGINNPFDLYDALSHLWSEYSCAPRMRDKWSKNNKTCGQCSITAFLAQDIFGGEVFGVPLGDGNFHCYNYVDGYIFDLTCEQFHGEELKYDLTNPQSRERHFLKQEKFERYLYLKDKLMKYTL